VVSSRAQQSAICDLRGTSGVLRRPNGRIVLSVSTQSGHETNEVEGTEGHSPHWMADAVAHVHWVKRRNSSSDAHVGLLAQCQTSCLIPKCPPMRATRNAVDP
jgi:hypothetical protein